MGFLHDKVQLLFLTKDVEVLPSDLRVVVREVRGHLAAVEALAGDTIGGRVLASSYLH